MENEHVSYSHEEIMEVGNKGIKKLKKIAKLYSISGILTGVVLLAMGIYFSVDMVLDIIISVILIVMGSLLILLGIFFIFVYFKKYKEEDIEKVGHYFVNKGNKDL